jgi:hypothetical protein
LGRGGLVEERYLKKGAWRETDDDDDGTWRETDRAEREHRKVCIE